jgi:hypothetical protein
MEASLNYEVSQDVSLVGAHMEAYMEVFLSFPCLATDLLHTVHYMNHQKRGNGEENLWQKCGKLLQML